MTSGAASEAFTFGDPIPVLDRRELLDYVECVINDRWYEPPVGVGGLARVPRRRASQLTHQRKVQYSGEYLYLTSAAESAGV